MTQPPPGMQAESTIKPFFSEDFEPFLDYLLVERRSKYDTTLHIPDSVQQNEVTAVVFKKGPGRKNDKGELIQMQCRVGDHIFIPVGVGYNLKVGDRHFTLVNDNQIIGRFPQPDAPLA